MGSCGDDWVRNLALISFFLSFFDTVCTVDPLLVTLPNSSGTSFGGTAGRLPMLALGLRDFAELEVVRERAKMLGISMVYNEGKRMNTSSSHFRSRWSTNRGESCVCGAKMWKDVGGCVLLWVTNLDVQ